MPAWRVTAPTSLVTSAGTLLVAVSAKTAAASPATSVPTREDAGGEVTAGGLAETFGGGRVTGGAGGISIRTGGADGGGDGFGVTTGPTGSGSEEATAAAVSRTGLIDPAAAAVVPASNRIETSPASENALPVILCICSSSRIAFSLYPKYGHIYYIFR